ncbi:MAG: thrombospondin type 3 repeat-containing protein [Parcubacteria group bacterium]|nr:thrombospondin type 3 repeat-containing protein [Parcubacteria group bacterium]
MRKLTFSVIVLFFALTTTVHAINVEYVGFLQSSVWFEKEPFFAGKSIRVYTALANSTEADVDGVVKFLSNGVEIGRGDVTLERQGGFQVIWTDWTPTNGTHKVFAEFINVVATEPGGPPQSIIYTGEVASAEAREVDTDTDGDGIGNKIDTDDDGDGVLDINDDSPLVPNTLIKEDKEAALATVEDAVERAAEIATDVADEFIPIAKSTTEKVVDTLEKTRLEQGAKVDAAKERLKEKLEEEQSGVELPDGEEADSTPFGAMRLVALTAASYTLNNAYAFYAAFMVALYFVVWRGLGWLFRKVRRNRDEF